MAGRIRGAAPLDFITLYLIHAWLDNHSLYFSFIERVMYLISTQQYFTHWFFFLLWFIVSSLENVTVATTAIRRYCWLKEIIKSPQFCWQQIPQECIPWQLMGPWNLWDVVTVQEPLVNSFAVLDDSHIASYYASECCLLTFVHCMWVNLPFLMVCIPSNAWKKNVSWWDGWWNTLPTILGLPILWGEEFIDSDW